MKYYDISNICFTKKEQINEYDYFKNKEYKEIQTDVFKQFTPEELKCWREEIQQYTYVYVCICMYMYV